MFKRKKGQASLDFLATYGWAFLIIIVAVAGLAYFDVFNYEKYMPESCKLDNNIFCGTVFQVKAGDSNDENSNITLQLRNNRAEKITITNFKIGEKNIADQGTFCNITSLGREISSGSLSEETFTITTNTPNCGIFDNKGNKKTFVIKMSYNISGTTITGEAEGTLTAKVI